MPGLARNLLCSIEGWSAFKSPDELPAQQGKSVMEFQFILRSAFRGLGVAAVMAVLSVQAPAATIGVATTPNPNSEFINGPWVLGYSFTVNSPITVTLLGVYDQAG